uniref:Zf-3CxxC domain-containing protein n=1 Tax=Caenorhabditis tropicalis TaxID=1561998 RepID=A0A1I7T2Y5_9PELO
MVVAVSIIHEDRMITWKCPIESTTRLVGLLSSSGKVQKTLEYGKYRDVLIDHQCRGCESIEGDIEKSLLAEKLAKLPILPRNARVSRRNRKRTDEKNKKEKREKYHLESRDYEGEGEEESDDETPFVPKKNFSKKFNKNISASPPSAVLRYNPHHQ